MPSVWEAHVSLDQETWAWHRHNPGQLSRLAKEAICREIAMDSLPDGLRDDALEAATAEFFAAWLLQGDYAVVGLELARHKATEEQMLQDADWLHVSADRLLATLQELFDLELETQLRKQAVLRAARKGDVV
ncbi:hypothetical protein M0R72_17935 [Candidatus Pacearchaeota archaeon]|jgi:predicted signal transduction protein with EAL and GGDEF domain|nr:hypothetical protein [Candidatus Pacearchaeota archaeon]